MTLVLDQKVEGPATHALVIGVALPDFETQYSASYTADRIAGLLLGLEIQGAPLASLDLLRSPSAFAPTHFEAGGRPAQRIEAPRNSMVRNALLAWRERLGRDPDNLGFFYYVGPTIVFNMATTLMIPAAAMGAAPGLAPHVDEPELDLDFENLWRGMGMGPPSRQLYFVDGCPVQKAAGRGRPAALLPTVGSPRKSLARARYEGDAFLNEAIIGGATRTLMARALDAALASGDSVGTHELGARIRDYVRLRAGEAGLSDFRATDAIEMRFEGDFIFRYRAPPAVANEEGGQEADAPAGADEPASAERADGQPGFEPPDRLPGDSAEPTLDDLESADGPTSAQVALVARLSEGQRECLRMVYRHKTSKEIARVLGISSDGVTQRIKSAMRTLGVFRRRDAAVLVALAEGMETDVPNPIPTPDRPVWRPGVAHEPRDAAPADKALRDRDIAARVARLSGPEAVVLRHVAQGKTSTEIALALGVLPERIGALISNAKRQMGVTDRRLAAQLLAEFEASPQRPAIQEPDDAAGQNKATQSPGGKARSVEPNTHFVSDDPEVERDELGRGPLAIALARRLHRIWCRSNGIGVPGGEEVEAGADDRAAFVLHLDAPWGGGKTSFANFLARVLNPFPAGCAGPAHFLAERAGGTEAVGTIFIDDPPGEGKKDPAADWPEDARRPWIVVPFNAWQAEHCAPPWWVFYQAIRKGCFNAVWAEGREASAPGQATAPPRPSLARRVWTWAGLWAREIGWRLRNPKIMALLGTAGIAGALILVLAWTKVIFAGDDGPAFDAGNALGFLLAGVGGISGLWGLGALLTESVAPGTDAVAERRSLGGGDPFDRFRRHFARTMKAVRRPVMVIVDDLDRCRPDFVVDLIRGIQTLLRSPRVVFVILGDRDWIERAFEAHHDAMKKVNVGAEQSFGARFVEKAIQMSFILPEMPETRQDGYVRRVLLGPGAGASGADAAPPPPPAELSQQLRADYRETVASAETAEDRKQAEQALRDKYQDAFQAAAQSEADAAEPDAAPPPVPDAETAGAQADKLLGEERAMLAAVDERMGKALLHRLEPLARAFPANPRQIKRIVNAITMYTCVAYLQMDMDETDERGVELAIWVILMTEWPATWRLLAGCPDLLAAIIAGKAAGASKAVRAIDATLLPGSAEATLAEIMRIRADARLRALIEGGGPGGAPALTLASVREFRSLTPLYAGKRTLAGGAASGETKH